MNKNKTGSTIIIIKRADNERGSPLGWLLRKTDRFVSWSPLFRWLFSPLVPLAATRGVTGMSSIIRATDRIDRKTPLCTTISVSHVCLARQINYYTRRHFLNNRGIFSFQFFIIKSFLWPLDGMFILNEKQYFVKKSRFMHHLTDKFYIILWMT